MDGTEDMAGRGTDGIPCVREQIFRSHGNAGRGGRSEGCLHVAKRNG